MKVGGQQGLQLLVNLDEFVVLQCRGGCSKPFHADADADAVEGTHAIQLVACSKTLAAQG